MRCHATALGCALRVPTSTNPTRAARDATTRSVIGPRAARDAAITPCDPFSSRARRNNNPLRPILELRETQQHTLLLLLEQLFVQFKAMSQHPRQCHRPKQPLRKRLGRRPSRQEQPQRQPKQPELPLSPPRWR